MPVLELVVDATGMERGSQQAQAALRGVSTAAEQTQAKVSQIGGSLRNTFQVVGGVSQVGQGITSTAAALTNMNTGLAAFAASRTLLEIGKTAQDFKDMAVSVTKVSSDIYGMTTNVTRSATAFEVLKTAMRAHPLLTIATVLGAAAGVMSLFTSGTKEAANAFDELAASMDKIRINDEVSRFLGVAGRSPGDRRVDEMKALYDTARTLMTTDRFERGQGAFAEKRYTMNDIARMLGSQDTIGLARDIGVRVPSMAEAGGPINQLGAVQGAQVPYSQFLSYVRSRYDELTTQRPVSMANTAWDVEDARKMSNSWHAAEQARLEAIANKQAEADRKHLEALERSVELATQMGGALGAAAFDVLAGIQGWRQALLSIVNSFGRQGLSSLGANLFNATARQATGTTNPGSVQNGGWTPS